MASERTMEGNDVIVGRDLGCVIIPVIISLVVIRYSDRVMDSSIEGGEDRRRRCSSTTKTSDRSRLMNAGTRKRPRPGFMLTLTAQVGFSSGVDDVAAEGLVRAFEWVSTSTCW